MYPSRFRQLTSVVALLIALGLSSVNTASAQTQTDPDFSNVDDILDGTRQLLRSDDLVFGFQGGRGLFLTSNSAIPPQTTNLQTLNDGSDRWSQPAVVGARLFNIASDVAVILVYDRLNQLLQWRLDSMSGTVASGMVGLPVPFSGVGTALSAVAGDFTGDRLDEIVVFFADVRTNAIVGTAVDPQDPTKGLKFGPALDPDINEPLSIKIVKATVLGQPRVYAVPFYSCPTRGSGGLIFEPYTIDPQSLALTLDFDGLFVANLPEGEEDNTCMHFVDMTTGRFSTATHDQLLVAYGVDGGNVKVIPFDFNAQGIAVQQPLFDTGYRTGGGQSFIRNGRFDWSSPMDHAALLISNDFNAPGIGTLRILSFEPNFTTTAGPEFQAGATSNECVNDMVVGNFDNRQPDPNNPSATIVNPNLQVAIPFNNCDLATPSAVNVRIFGVDPATQQISHLHEFVTGVPGAVLPSTLATVDLQGRSLLLGPPQKVTVTASIQPQVVLGLPPMHIDFIPDATNVPNGTPTVLNLTTFPSLFFSQYQTQQSGSAQSANTNTTSYTVGTKESAEAKFSYGIPDVASVSAELKSSAEQTHENTVSAKYNTYTSNTFDVSTKTGFSDFVWFTSKRFNMYIYPVIGQLGCPQSQPACPDAQKVPLHVVFSGPDQVTSHRIDGTGLEWYQPVQEPGNVFSYPWNAMLLQNLYPGFSPLTADPATVWATDTSGSSVSVTWTQGSGSDVTSGSVSTQSFDISASVSADVNIEGFGASASAGFDYNSSSSISTLNESSSTVGSSTGIQIVKPSFANPSNYAYVAQTYIFGQKAPTGTVHQIPLNTDVQSSGPLWTAFTVDPTDTEDGAGSWWSQAYTKPDVALNHPSRWTWSPPTLPGDDVLTFNTANPNNPVGSEFYYMKGLYITPASANGQGSQITMAPVGESLELQARVYNYSLADMPSGTTVHVRFYGQAWDNTAHNFIAGSEFVINEVILNPIPGFRGGQTLTPNWALASTTFDTTPYSDTYLIFWVVVWMEQNGQLVSEMQGHGITAIPGAMTPPTAVAIETYSNNVGFYKQPFFVCPQDTCPAQSALTAVAATPVAATAPPLTMERVKSLPPGCRGSSR